MPWPNCWMWPSATTDSGSPVAAGRIVLVDGLDRLLTPFQPSAAAYAARTLERPGRGAASSATWSDR